MCETPKGQVENRFSFIRNISLLPIKFLLLAFRSFIQWLQLQRTAVRFSNYYMVDRIFRLSAH
jgi:hypothetical protein